LGILGGVLWGPWCVLGGPCGGLGDPWGVLGGPWWILGGALWAPRALRGPLKNYENYCFFNTYSLGPHLVLQNAIGVIKINDFQTHVPEDVRASMRSPRQTTLSSQITPCEPERMNFRGNPCGALKFQRKAPCEPDAIFPVTVIKKQGSSFETCVATARARKH